MSLRRYNSDVNSQHASLLRHISSRGQGPLRISARAPACQCLLASCLDSHLDSRSLHLLCTRSAAENGGLECESAQKRPDDELALPRQPVNTSITSSVNIRVFLLMISLLLRGEVLFACGRIDPSRRVQKQVLFVLFPPLSQHHSGQKPPSISRTAQHSFPSICEAFILTLKPQPHIHSTSTISHY